VNDVVEEGWNGGWEADITSKVAQCADKLQA
jgi:hypothetical protein